MKIALTGYGKMGHELEDLINGSDKHQVVSISCRNPGEIPDREGIAGADVVIDFTSPDIILKTIEAVTAMGKNMVVGTTGWYDNLKKVKNLVDGSKTGLIYGQNFSVGANIFFKIVGFTSNLASRFGDYDVAGFEIHHTGKKDSPSGTAKKIAQVIMENYPVKKKLETGRIDRQIEKDELHFASLRAGRNFGFHEVIFDGAADEIKLSHTAHGRRGFAEGAIMAAEFIKNKTGFYTFDDIFEGAK